MRGGRELAVNLAGTVLDNGSALGLGGRAPRRVTPGATVRVRRDGTVSVTSPGLGDTRLTSLPTTEATELLAVLRDPPSSVYSATRGAFNSLTKALANELGPHVRVHAIAPTSIRTPAG
ncbi:SDR family NAD(P)-dependent oxidoreductase [Amycolatopsis thermoflava]|uniref:Enoyl-ACP reductase-like protein n=1 Tax=Amycolatopsis thermoflava TaxID=84480 RepID=A0A3N2GPZ3_9PSEU|nr:SDR family NAD(P)-dependent oxidoreductase [Amycolatopsis thermoflava]ROS38460.1 enoyl-ACP reductase-like protein [Amycolatopsis thermoflava]